LSFSDNSNNSIGQSNTCLLVNPAPSTLTYSPQTTQSQVGYLNTTPHTVGTITISWQNTDYSAGDTFNCSASKQFPPTSQWGNGGTCAAGILRIDIVPATNISSGTTVTYFLHPTNTLGATPSLAYNNGNNGLIESAYCAAPTSQAVNACRVSITNMTASIYYIRLSAIYSGAAVKITDPNPFIDSETEIDSTGRISDVLRRLVVYVPNTANGVYPDYAIESSGLVCKQYAYSPGPPITVLPLNSPSNCP
jgi:hypothetical protein